MTKGMIAKEQTNVPKLSKATIIALKRTSSRMQKGPDGERVFIRFSLSQRWEHQILIFSFTLLAITGLVQRYSDQPFISGLINYGMGGIETVRLFHHIAAIIFFLEGIFHLWQILVMLFVNRESSNMLPSLKDVSDLLQMISFNLGKTNKRPQFDRYTVEEKIEYWALIWGSIIMMITGIIQWFPIQTTRIFPGIAVPISRVIHSWEAVLATLSILIWHMYHAVIKEKNKSIFTGMMSEKLMKEEHPLEYKRILRANEILSNANIETQKES